MVVRTHSIEYYDVIWSQEVEHLIQRYQWLWWNVAEYLAVKMKESSLWLMLHALTVALIGVNHIALIVFSSVEFEQDFFPLVCRCHPFMDLR